MQKTNPFINDIKSTKHLGDQVLKRIECGILNCTEDDRRKIKGMTY